MPIFRKNSDGVVTSIICTQCGQELMGETDQNVLTFECQECGNDTCELCGNKLRQLCESCNEEFEDAMDSIEWDDDDDDEDWMTEAFEEDAL